MGGGASNPLTKSGEVALQEEKQADGCWSMSDDGGKKSIGGTALAAMGSDGE
jgi:hypothetical protein